MNLQDSWYERFCDSLNLFSGKGLWIQYLGCCSIHIIQWELLIFFLFFKKKMQSLQQHVPSSYKARSQNTEENFYLKKYFYYLTTFLYLFKEIWLSSDLHTHSFPFNLSCPVPCQQSHFCRVKIMWKKRDFSFLFFPFLFLYEGWMNFQCSCIPVSYLLIVCNSTAIRLAKDARRDGAVVASLTSGRIMSQSWDLR